MTLGPWPPAMGGWTVDDFNMCGPAIRPLNLETLWMPAPTRGENRIIPGVNGALARSRRVDQRVCGVQLHIGGDCDQDGDPFSDPTEGLVSNLNDLWVGVIAPPTPPAVTRTSVVTLPSGDDVEAGIQVAEFVSEKAGPNLLRAVLTVVIPAGAFYAA